MPRQGASLVCCNQVCNDRTGLMERTGNHSRDRHGHVQDSDTDTSEDEKARKQRAERLRKQIEAMKAPQGDQEAEADKPGSTKPESPREFIERKMHQR